MFIRKLIQMVASESSVGVFGRSLGESGDELSATINQAIESVILQDVVRLVLVSL